MQQYFIPTEQFTETHVTVMGEDAKHMQKVMRMKIGDLCQCADRDGHVFNCMVESFEGQNVILKLVEEKSNNAELPIRITLAQGIPKGDKFDTIVQKGTECGAYAFVPFSAERSIAKWTSKWDKKKTRFEKIAKEAAEQSHRDIVPYISEPMDLKELIAYGQKFSNKLIAYEETAKLGEQQGLPTLLKSISPSVEDKLLIVIGPEGGLSTAEVQQFKQAGFICCGLGKRILRTETAPIYFLSCVSYHFELLYEVNK
ncbi:16S rRNA (uracil(1498)-N(3))-methyltransferase [Terrilactibacillus sp. BCM23-1]|uniref:Ribosomal RNA small subunit methyltransferase E n=1 Tax=Terrilactibacillus tamarindi TaxID=2599694 RepID=A0A6N8CU15_9BACI|nr:16S rRNA (uracil(1498)-N(3))-methyltransferase [Terrilactibacillus tamarindi]MTT32505.1 16S rRNA (uracil(1498)-N(3))-methyltransferase [Terrilactibacillus tamarindi]